MERLFCDSVYFGVCISLVSYAVGVALRRKTGWGFMNPLLVSIVLVIAALLVLGVDYGSYSRGAAWLSYLLTPATVCLAVPLYQQVMDDLKGEIARGVYAAGSRIPSEMELAKSYGVGRVTVRRAIEELSRAGYLNRQQGRGTFVCAPKLKRKIRQKGDVQSFTEGCAANDMVPGARLVSRTVVAATHEDAAFFGVEPGCELIVVERVRTADGIPVMLENNAFVLADHPYLQTLADEDLSDNSIFALVAEHSGRAPLKSDPCTVEIALADAQAAPLLEVPVGEPLFYMEAYFTDEDERPLLLGRQKIVGSRYVFDI